MARQTDRHHEWKRVLAAVMIAVCAQAAPCHGQIDATQAEVIANIVSQPVGSGTLADFDLPDDFLRRLADRIIQSSYRDHFHRVFRDVPGDEMNANAPPASGVSTPAWMNVQPIALSAESIVSRRAVAEGRPANRAFLAPILDAAGDPFATTNDNGLTPAERRARELITSRLARDGIMTTLVRTIDMLGADHDLTVLRRIGFPVDLLRHFPDAGDATEVVRFIAGRLQAGAAVEAIASELGGMSFQFQASAPGFRVTTESGEHEIDMLRLQLTRGAYWKGQGAGGSLDVARQLVQALPDVRFAVSVEQRFAAPFVDLARKWSNDDATRLIVIPEPFVVSQWAQDNGKAGVIKTPGGSRRAATITPRYASRREDGSVFIPGESWLMDGLAGTGHPVIHSSLLFQGGDLLAVREPHNGRRLLLVGEANIYRNTSLGLSRAQTIEAFTVEFGVEACIVLPSVSFHIDYDVTVRAQGDHLIAFVNDTHAAVQIILACGIDAMAKGGLLSESQVGAARDDLSAKRYESLLQVMGRPLYGRVDGQGRFPLSIARHFATDTMDSPVGNLERVLVAMDIVAAIELGDAAATDDSSRAAYFRSIQRRLRDQRELEALLGERGFHVVRIPSLAAGDRSLNAVNGIHDRTRYLMPAYGGLFAPLDEAARGAFATALAPDVSVLPIHCAETQRRSGAIHCAAAAYERSILPRGP